MLDTVLIVIEDFLIINCEFKLLRGGKVDGSKVFDMSKVIGNKEVVRAMSECKEVIKLIEKEDLLASSINTYKDNYTIYEHWLYEKDINKYILPQYRSLLYRIQHNALPIGKKYMWTNSLERINCQKQIFTVNTTKFIATQIDGSNIHSISQLKSNAAISTSASSPSSLLPFHYQPPCYSAF